MSEVSSSGPALRGLAARLVGRPVAIDRTGAKPASDRQSERASERPSDRVELSERAKYLAKLHQVPAVRQGLIDQVKAQIESGEYDTPEKFDAALDGLIEDADLLS
jgi:anti-sigma28 factor (negative regulator of flagellin synthesis)